MHEQCSSGSRVSLALLCVMCLSTQYRKLFHTSRPFCPPKHRSAQISSHFVYISYGLLLHLLIMSTRRLRADVLGLNWGNILTTPCCFLLYYSPRELRRVKRSRRRRKSSITDLPVRRQARTLRTSSASAISRLRSITLSFTLPICRAGRPTPASLVA